MIPKQLVCVVFLFINVVLFYAQKTVDPADLVDPLIGARGRGSCMAGPCLPHSSVYPSPNTLNAFNGGYREGENIVGFAQLHTQGTGGLGSYGNFLITPQIGLETNETKHASAKADEVAKCFYYKVRLTKGNILCEVVPGANTALYRFTFPTTGDATITLDIARKLKGGQGMEDGYVKVINEENLIIGGGTYKSNWPSENTRWKMYFAAKFSSDPACSGTWKDDDIKKGNSYAKGNNCRMGAFYQFNTHSGKPVYVKIAVSFKSEKHAEYLLSNEIPGWNFDKLKENAKRIWNNELGKIAIDAPDSDKTIFYTNLFHSYVQPRNRTGNNRWNTNEVYWDDHYTLWDSWKTLFPLMCILNPEMVSANINSFISRYKHNKYVAEAFINGTESAVGQGGNTVDNVIADAYVKDIKGVDWKEAYKILKYNADSMRTPHYIKYGYHDIEEKHSYSNRMYSGSGTLAFSYDDYCVAMVAKGLCYIDDYRKYLLRSDNWKNTWNESATSDDFSGFIMGKHRDGKFENIDPKTGYNKYFYEGTCWIYSYEIPQDVTGMIQYMGGKEVFTKRLIHALDNLYINFGNEPSFMTLWWFCHPEINRPDLCAKYLRSQLLPLYTTKSLPGDDDQGAMGSLYVFARCGFFPIAGQDFYYLHGPSFKHIRIKLSENKTLIINAHNASEEFKYIKTVRFNGKLLKKYIISHADLMKGGILEFEMTNQLRN